MSKAQQRPAADLFNNSLLSDIKIKQVSSDGKIREYYAHKAVLSSDSRYFYKAFTGNFREASESEMTIYDDDPDHIEFFIKFMYTHHYDEDKIEGLAGGDHIRRASIPCKIYAIADKYDMPTLREHIVKDIDCLLRGPDALDLLKELIPVHYEGVSSAGGSLGKTIVSRLGSFRLSSFLLSQEYISLVQAYPIFGADMALSDVFKTLYRHSCTVCLLPYTVGVPNYLARVRTSIYCSFCGGKNNFTRSDS